MFWWFRNIRTSFLNELEISAIRTAWWYSSTFEMTLLCAECHLLSWQRYNKTTSSVPITAYSRQATACHCFCRAENGLTRYKNEQEIHAIGSTTLIVSGRDRSTCKLECVRMFRRLWNIRIPFLKELEISAVRSPKRDSWDFLIALMREESLFRYGEDCAKALRVCQ